MGGIPGPDPSSATDAAAIERLFEGAADPASADYGWDSEPAAADETDDRETS